MRNRYQINGRVTTIYVPLRIRRSNVKLEVPTLIDTADLCRVARFPVWRACRSIYGIYINAGRVPLHHVILGESLIIPGLEADHVNRNPLDNRRKNLRLVTRRDNCLNRQRGHKFASLMDRVRPFVTEIPTRWR